MVYVIIMKIHFAQNLISDIFLAEFMAIFAKMFYIENLSIVHMQINSTNWN